MLLTRLALLGLVALLLSCEPKPVPSAPQVTKGLGYQLAWDARDFRSVKVERAPRLTQQENGSDIPLDVAPARVRFAVQAQRISGLREPKSPDFAWQGHLTLIPLADASVPDYDQAYPTFRAKAAELKRLLKARPTQVAIEGSIPDLNPVEATHSCHARIRYVETPWCTGVLFITRYAQDSAELAPDQLSAVFQGLSRDGSVYLTAEFPVGFTGLLTEKAWASADIEQHYEAYLRDVEAHLNQAPESRFAPPLSRLESLIQSLAPGK